MGLEYMESATPYAVGDVESLLRRWTQIFSSGGVGAANITGTNRNGRALALGAGSTVSKTLTQKTSWTVGWAFYANTSGGWGTNDIYQGFNVGSRIFYVRLEPDGTLSIRTANAIIHQSTIALHMNTWYYIEVAYSLSGTTDIGVTATLYVNGENVAAGTAGSGVNVNTLINQLATINRHSFSTGGITGSTYLRDMYILSDTTLPWGDVRLGRIMPNGDVTTDWSSTTTPAYTCVNEVPPDDDGSYISSNTVDQKELFDWEDVSPFSGTIKGIQYSILARKDGEGSRAILHTVGAAGSEATVDGPFYVDDNYVWYHVPMETDPTAGAWTIASLNAQRFGVKLAV